MSLRKPTGLYPDPFKDAKGDRLIVEVGPNQGPGYVFYGTTFALTSPKDVPPSYTINVTPVSGKGLNPGSYPGAMFVTKITFVPIGTTPPVNTTAWDPFSQVVRSIDVRETFTPHYERTVFKAFLMGGGGGGVLGWGGYKPVNDRLVGGGGGRGVYVVTDNLATSKPTELGLYTVSSISAAAGTGGGPGLGGMASSISGGTIVGEIVAPGGSPGNDGNGGDGGGGGGYHRNYWNFSPGNPGNAGQGQSGGIANYNNPQGDEVGGNGGDGPNITGFPPIVPKSAPGGLGESFVAGGAGGILLTNGSRMGNGGHGTSNGFLNQSLLYGGNGYVCVLERYIAF